MERKQIKLFPVWAYQKEAQYLTKMAHDGWKFTDWRLARYHFFQTEPLPGTIQLDFQSSEDIAAYVKLAQDAGWQLLFRHDTLNGAWLYFYNSDVTAKLYTDKTSKISLLNRLRTRWTIFGLAIFVFELWLIDPFSASFVQQAKTVGMMVFLALVIFEIGIYIWNFIALTGQIRRLKQ